MFKGPIAHKGREVPKSHYIDELGISLHLPDEIFEFVLDLSSDYELSGYPDIRDSVPNENYDEGLAEERVISAQKIFVYLYPRYNWLLEDFDEK